MLLGRKLILQHSIIVICISYKNVFTKQTVIRQHNQVSYLFNIGFSYILKITHYDLIALVLF